jgi:hypothetical protein
MTSTGLGCARRGVRCALSVLALAALAAGCGGTPHARSLSGRAAAAGASRIAASTSPAATGSPRVSPISPPVPSSAPTTSPLPGAGCAAAANSPGGPDPWGGCWPGPANTGVPAGTRLTDYHGSCTIRTSQVVIDASLIRCQLQVLAAGVTIADSRIAGTVHTQGNGSVLIKDTTIDGGADHSESVGGAHLTVLRDNIYGDQHEVHCYTDCVVADSWLHDNYNGLAQGWHENGFFNDGGRHFTITHNSIYCVGGCTADIAFIPDGDISDATVSRNLLVATRYASYCLYPSSEPQYKPGVMTHIVVTGNVFQLGANGKCGRYGPVAGWDRPNRTAGTDGYGNIWARNIWNNGIPLRL